LLIRRQVIFDGTTTFGYKEWKGPLISVSGNNITVTGSAGHLIDAGGPKWWDGKGSNGGKTKPKVQDPHHLHLDLLLTDSQFFSAHALTHSTITSLNIKNIPVQGFSINTAHSLTLSHITIDNSAGDGPTGGHNTDAFDVGSSSDITISHANITNQDDCLAINSGRSIRFLDGTCSGGHGLSIGSVGGRSDNDVDGVLIANSTIARSQNGVRIKTVYGATGSVKNVVYRNITLEGITKYGVVVQQDYENGSPTGTPTSGVPITNLTVDDVRGSVAAKATPVYILCGKGSCSDWVWKGVQVTGGKASAKCAGVPSGASC
jgi:polygalacturonase